jgi:hypothetical protein
VTLIGSLERFERVFGEGVPIPQQDDYLKRIRE